LATRKKKKLGRKSKILIYFLSDGFLVNSHQPLAQANSKILGERDGDYR